jgi:hypothetical protein
MTSQNDPGLWLPDALVSHVLLPYLPLADQWVMRDWLPCVAKALDKPETCARAMTCDIEQALRAKVGEVFWDTVLRPAICASHGVVAGSSTYEAVARRPGVESNDIDVFVPMSEDMENEAKAEVAREDELRQNWPAEEALPNTVLYHGPLAPIDEKNTPPHILNRVTAFNTLLRLGVEDEARRLLAYAPHPLRHTASHLETALYHHPDVVLLRAAGGYDRVHGFYGVRTFGVLEPGVITLADHLADMCNGSRQAGNRKVLTKIDVVQVRQPNDKVTALDMAAFVQDEFDLECCKLTYVPSEDPSIATTTTVFGGNLARIMAGGSACTYSATDASRFVQRYRKYTERGIRLELPRNLQASVIGKFQRGETEWEARGESKIWSGPGGEASFDGWAHDLEYANTSCEHEDCIFSFFDMSHIHMQSKVHLGHRNYNIDTVLLDEELRQLLQGDHTSKQKRESEGDPDVLPAAKRPRLS